MRHIACFFLMLFVPTLFAAEVVKIKGTSALIDLKGEPAAVGDSFFALRDGKRAAIIRITKVKGERAIGKVLKGKAAAGMSVELKQDAVTPRARTARKDGSNGMTSGRSAWGLMAGYAQDKMDVNVLNSNTQAFLSRESLSGTGYSVKGMVDYEVFNQIWFRGLAGLEMFNVTGGAKCGKGNAEACDAKISYIAFDFWGRYVFAKSGTIRPWLGAGAGLLFPASKSATAIAAGSISTTSVVMIGGGLDWHVSPTLYIPISLEYGLLPKSDEVEATWLAVRIGLAFPM